MRRQHVKRRAFEPVVFNPLSSTHEYIFVVAIEAQNKGAIHLYPMLMKHADPADISRLRRLLMGIHQILIAQ
jgi:ATP sulfurylase